MRLDFDWDSLSYLHKVVVVTCGEAQQVKERGVFSSFGGKESYRELQIPNSHGISSDWTYRVQIWGQLTTRWRHLVINVAFLAIVSLKDQ